MYVFPIYILMSLEIPYAYPRDTVPTLKAVTHPSPPNHFLHSFVCGRDT